MLSPKEVDDHRDTDLGNGVACNIDVSPRFGSLSPNSLKQARNLLSKLRYSWLQVIGTQDGWPATIFIQVLLSAIVQYICMALCVNEIVEGPYGYYTATADGRRDPVDYIAHVACFFTYLAFGLLVAAMLLWCFTVAVCVGLDFFMASYRRLSRISQLVAFLALCFVECVLNVMCVTEVKMLASMACHFLDVDLIDTLGVKDVLFRQKELHSPHLRQVAGILFILMCTQLGFFLIGRCILSRLSFRWMKRVFLWLPAAIFILGLIVSVQTNFLQEKVLAHKANLPFNFLEKTAQSALIPVQPKTVPLELAAISDTGRGPQLNGYPIMDQANPPKVGKRKNIIYILQEGSVASEWHGGPQTLQFVKENNCAHTEKHYCSGHTTEMSTFALMYGIHPFHFYPFAANYVPSFASDVLKANGYVVARLSASSIWVYPNKNLLRQWDVFAEEESNEELLPRLRGFLQERQSDEQPFFLLLHMSWPSTHRRIGPMSEAELEQLRLDVLLPKDRDRRVALDMLAEFNQLNQSLIFLSSDHGNMNYGNRFGENGHGQPESTWWNDKCRVPLWVCAPGQTQSVGDINNVDMGFASQVDWVPTWMSALQLNPAMAPRQYSSGRDLLARTTSSVGSSSPAPLIFMCPRFFPKKAKTVGIVDGSNKYWFRITKFRAALSGNSSLAGPMGSLVVLPERVQDLEDNDLCTARSLRDSYAALESRYPHPLLPEATSSDQSGGSAKLSCRYVTGMKRVVHKFATDEFWRFFQLDVESANQMDQSTPLNPYIKVLLVLGVAFAAMMALTHVRNTYWGCRRSQSPSGKLPCKRICAC